MRLGRPKSARSSLPTSLHVREHFFAVVHFALGEEVLDRRHGDVVVVEIAELVLYLTQLRRDRLRVPKSALEKLEPVAKATRCRADAVQRCIVRRDVCVVRKKLVVPSPDLVPQEVPDEQRYGLRGIPRQARFRAPFQEALYRIERAPRAGGRKALVHSTRALAAPFLEAPNQRAKRLGFVPVSPAVADHVRQENVGVARRSESVLDVVHALLERNDDGAAVHR